MSNLEIINAQGVGYTTEDFIPFRPSSCDKNGSMSFKVKADGHFKRKVVLKMSSSHTGCTYKVEIQGGTINGLTEFTKEQPLTRETNFQENLEVEVEFTNEATISLEQTIPENIYNEFPQEGWVTTPVTCERCSGREDSNTINIHSVIYLFGKGFRIDAITCGVRTGV